MDYCQARFVYGGNALVCSLPRKTYLHDLSNPGSHEFVEGIPLNNKESKETSSIEGTVNDEIVHQIKTAEGNYICFHTSYADHEAMVMTITSQAEHLGLIVELMTTRDDLMALRDLIEQTLGKM